MPPTTPGSNRERELDTTRKPLAQHGQYEVNEIIRLDGVKPSFDAFDLMIRGHTDLIVGDCNHNDALEHLSIAFNGPKAVGDIGIELLRASHIIVPFEAVRLLEKVTGKEYSDTRWVENPLNYSLPFQEDPVTYPSSPGAITALDDDYDDSDFETIA